jgi:hypothetical protein
LIRRIFRIYPLSFLVVVLVELFRFPVGHLRDRQFFFANLHATGILSNIFLLQDLTHTESAIAPFWSLPYEMRMYFFRFYITIPSGCAGSPSVSPPSAHLLASINYVEEPMIALGHRLSNQLQERRDAPEVAPAN